MRECKLSCVEGRSSNLINMKKILLILCSFAVVSLSYAETIVLKNGKSIEGKVVEKTSDYIKLEIMEGVNSTYFFDDIQTIDGKPIESAAAVAQPLAVKSDNQETISVDKKDLLDKIKKAGKEVSRISVDEITTVDMHNFMHVKSRKVSDMDFKNKIMQMTGSIIDYELDTDTLIASMKEQARLKAKQAGKTDQEISVMLKTLDANSSKLKSSTKDMINRIKNSKTVILITKDSFYLEYDGKWYKIASVAMGKFWDAMENMRNASNPESAIKAFADVPGVPSSMQEQLSAGNLTGIINENTQADSITSIKDKEISGVSCYEIDMNLKGMADAMVESILAYANKDKDKTNMFFSDYKVKMIVSKDNYRVLNSSQNIEMTLSSDKGNAIKTYADTQISYSYPAGSIAIPSGIKNAKPIKDEEELKSIIASSIAGS